MLKIVLAIASCFCITFLNAQTAADSSKPKIMAWKDVSTWKYTPGASISPDGRWVAYQLTMAEGDGELILQKVNDTTRRRFSTGGGIIPYAFSENGKWVVFKETAKYKEKLAASKPGGKQTFDKLHIYDIDKDKDSVFEKVASFAFNNKEASHIAFTIAADRAGGPGAAAGSDLILINLNSFKSMNLGNVNQFEFNTQGDKLAYTIDAVNKNGNGLYVFYLNSGKNIVLDNDKSIYKELHWKKDKDALSALKMTKDDKFKKDKGSVIGVRNLQTIPEIFNYEPIKDSIRFPQKMTISGVRSPFWSEDLSRIYFGINSLEAVKKEIDSDTSLKKKIATTDTTTLTIAKIKSDTSIKSAADLRKALEKLEAKPKTSGQEVNKDDIAKPDMVIWHWKDKRLQSRQAIMEGMDSNFSYLAVYDVTTKKFTRINNSTQRQLLVFPQQKYAIASDIDKYEREQNLSGQNYTDLYIVDLKTGAKTLFKEKFYLPSYQSYPQPAPDGEKFIYGEDGNFYSYNIPLRKSLNLTGKLPVAFIDKEDDHNVTKPLTNFLDWDSNSKLVLISDGWDLWQLAADGSTVANLTKTARSSKMRYQYRFQLDPEEKGFNAKMPQYFRTYGEWNKKSGIAQIQPGNSGLNAGAQNLLWNDVAIVSLQKPKNSTSLFYGIQDNNSPTDFFVASNKLQNAWKVPGTSPDFKKYLWSAGTRLVNYVTDKGDSLQGTLFLPAGYEEGKKYPTMVYYYEKLSQTAHNFANPSFPGGGWNPTLYTGNGYAVFIPDIVYKLDDPGMSNVWAVIPAVKEAIKTGVVDPDKIGITGHSWGGYQTAFLITQTNMFKAAAAGAPLTDLVSMYNLIYWNSGGGNMSIFEASQGRFRTGPWDNWDAYLRNSPLYNVKKVNTPLLLLHNDKDGAVDFTQGIEYYSALRRLNKPVVMLQYKGENHGLMKLENRKDYAVRMMEFFDHYLKGKPMPDWLQNGVDKLKLAEHLEKRAF